MALQFQFRRGTTAETNAFTGALGEVTVDTDKDAIVVHDGSTAGGFPVAARADASGTITLLKKDGTSSGVINQAGLFNNTLTSTNTDQAATAAQAKVLKDNIDSNLAASYGVGQTLQNLLGSRLKNTTYTNSTGKTTTLIVTVSTGNDNFIGINVSGQTICTTGVSAGDTVLFTPIPNGASYSISDITGSGSTIQKVYELR